MRVQWTSLASAAFGCFCFASAIAGCFPRSNLDGYSIGGSGSGGTGQDMPPASDAGSADTGAPTGSEEIDDMVPLVPGSDAGSLLGGDMGPPVAPDAGAPGCDGSGEFESSDGASCYFIATDASGWFGARDACRAWGGDLVKIETREENEFLVGRLSIDVWIGANDRDSEGSYVWADGDAVTFFDWSVGQPDNFQGQENCVEIRASDLLWNDRPCGGDPQGYLCER